MNLPVSLQLYSVRDETKNDFIGTLEKVAEMGYYGVEFAGYGEIPASKMKETLDRLGLKAVGSHIPTPRLQDYLDEEIEFNLEVGNKYIICPYGKFETLSELMESISFYKKVAKKCKEKGLQFCYHNHAHEFEMIDGKHQLDIIYEETDPLMVMAELDTYWVKRAGVDPVGYIEKYSGRCPLIHLKDMDPEDQSFAEIGNGTMNIKAIIEAAKKAGTEHLVVEQDRCKRPPLESVKISIDNLKNKIMV